MSDYEPGDHEYEKLLYIQRALEAAEERCYDRLPASLEYAKSLTEKFCNEEGDLIEGKKVTFRS